MEDFPYNYIKNKHGDKEQMLPTDTGSLMYKIESENVYMTTYSKIKSYLTSVSLQNIQKTTMLQITSS